jgi:prepilin-type processing-associated H-X9-DG protein
MNLGEPMFLFPSLTISPDNQAAVQQTVKLFLCPADKMQPVSGAVYGVSVMGPVNYAACLGSGITTDGSGQTAYGSPWNADGMFQAAVNGGFNQITDGLSNTAAFSESTLGEGPTSMMSATIPGDPQKVYAHVGSPLTPALCATPSEWNYQNLRGYSWAAGELRCASYNHYYPPNSPNYDCITDLPGTSGAQKYTAVGFRAARSNHPGGVNVLLADGSVRFVTNGIQPEMWSALGTQAGGETVSDPNY